MADQRLPELNTGTVIGTTLCYVRPVGQTRDQKATVAAILAGGGAVTKVGTPANTELGVFTGDGTLAGESELTYSTAILTFSGANGKVRGSLATAGAILNEASSSVNPTLIPNVGDTATGIGGASNTLYAVVRGTLGTKWQHTTAGDDSIVVTHKLVTGVTASVTQTQGQGLINGNRYTEVTTVANVDDVITLHNTGAAEFIITIINTGANRLQIFPPSGDAILPNGVDASVTLAVNKSMTFYTLDGTNWMILAEPADLSSAGDVSKVGTPVNNELGVWTGDGTLEGESDLTYASGVFTVAAEILADNGTVSLPAYSYSGDPDTGFFWLQSGEVAFAGNGVGKMIFHGNGLKGCSKEPSKNYRLWPEANKIGFW